MRGPLMTLCDSRWQRRGRLDSTPASNARRTGTEESAPSTWARRTQRRASRGARPRASRDDLACTRGYPRQDSEGATQLSNVVRGTEQQGGACWADGTRRLVACLVLGLDVRLFNARDAAVDCVTHSRCRRPAPRPRCHAICLLYSPTAPPASSSILLLLLLLLLLRLLLLPLLLPSFT